MRNRIFISPAKTGQPISDDNLAGVYVLDRDDPQNNAGGAATAAESRALLSAAGLDPDAPIHGPVYVDLTVNEDGGFEPGMKVTKTIVSDLPDGTALLGLLNAGVVGRAEQNLEKFLARIAPAAPSGNISSRG